MRARPEAAVQAVRPGGTIVIGDVRSLPLIQAFHTSVQFHQAPAAMTRAELQRRVSQQLAQEEELALDPAFFTSLRGKIPQIGRVDILPRRGRHHNELTKFRYQVLLHVGPASVANPAVASLDWREGAHTPAELQQLLLEERRPLAITHIANRRLSVENELLRWLAGGAGPETVRGTAHRPSEPAPYRHRSRGTVDHPAAALPCRTALNWSQHGADGSYAFVSERWPRQRRPAQLPI